MVTRLDRLGRSVANLVQFLEKLRTSGIQLVVIEQGIDTTNTYGKLLFNTIASFAEFEHDLMLERTRDGLAAPNAATLADWQDSGLRRIMPGDGE